MILKDIIKLNDIEFGKKLSIENEIQKTNKMHFIDAGILLILKIKI